MFAFFSRVFRIILVLYVLKSVRIYFSTCLSSSHRFPFIIFSSPSLSGLYFLWFYHSLQFFQLLFWSHSPYVVCCDEQTLIWNIVGVHIRIFVCPRILGADWRPSVRLIAFCSTHLGYYGRRGWFGRVAIESWVSNTLHINNKHNI